MIIFYFEIFLTDLIVDKLECKVKILENKRKTTTEEKMLRLYQKKEKKRKMLAVKSGHSEGS